MNGIELYAANEHEKKSIRDCYKGVPANELHDDAITRLVELLPPEQHGEDERCEELQNLIREMYYRLEELGKKPNIVLPVKVAIPLIRLTEMSGDHFSRIFTEGFAPSFMKEIIQAFKSLYGFHTAISEYGKFDSHRLAFELGYDVEFTLDQPEWMRKQLTGE